MALTSAKANSIAGELLDALQKRFGKTTTGAQDGGLDTDGNKLIKFGPGTAGSQSALIKLSAFSNIGADVLGNQQQSYSPSVAQVVLEQSTIANVSLLLAATLMPLMDEIAKFGTRVELFLTANGTAPSATGITGNPAAVYDGASLQYRQMASL